PPVPDERGDDVAAVPHEVDDAKLGEELERELEDALVARLEVVRILVAPDERVRREPTVEGANELGQRRLHMGREGGALGADVELRVARRVDRTLDPVEEPRLVRDVDER